jgi:hypothetical protein
MVRIQKYGFKNGRILEDTKPKKLMPVGATTIQHETGITLSHCSFTGLAYNPSRNTAAQMS